MSRPSITPGIALFSIALILALLVGCTPKEQPEFISPEDFIQATDTPLPDLPTAAPQPSPTPLKLSLWVSPDLPDGFREEIDLLPNITAAKNKKEANLQLDFAVDPQAKDSAVSYLTYALVAPFPTILDQVSPQDLKNAWQGKSSGYFTNIPLRMTAETYRALESWWGAPDAEAVEIVSQEALLDSAWENMPSWAIIPFEDIEPRWKVLRIDDQSPFDRDFEPQHYPLAIPILLAGSAEALQALPALTLPTNRDPHKLTVLAMTGVTALTRNLATAMEENGITYPVEQIRPWLAEADLTHISNEVSFHRDCPEPGPGRGNRRFCSSPRYMELLETAGVDIIELTGNHNMDWGPDPFLESLELYRDNGMQYYGGGEDLENAQQPLRIEHNGNRLVFLGCSPAGPETAWAAVNEPGSAPCDMEKIEQQVKELRKNGYLPIVTFQAFEVEDYVPSTAQGMPDFRRMARAGAVIVSGSQSHYPQTMTFVDGNFIHYGLGNLFFDQMKPIAFRQGFIDRHVFYNGKYLGAELLTTLVEEMGQPRPMTEKERQELLGKIFSLSDWQGK